jgi:hypothetical protein
MNARFPVSIHIAMTLAAETIALREIDQLPIEQPQLIPIFCIMAIEAPPHGLGMVKLDVGMFVFEFPLLEVRFHGGMAVTAWENAFSQRGRRHGKLLHRKGSYTECQ